MRVQLDELLVDELDVGRWLDALCSAVDLVDHARSALVVCSQTSGGGGGGTEGCAATSCSLMICQTARGHPVIICRSNGTVQYTVHDLPVLEPCSEQHIVRNAQVRAGRLRPTRRGAGRYRRQGTCKVLRSLMIYFKITLPTPAELRAKYTNLSQTNGRIIIIYRIFVQTLHL